MQRLPISLLDNHYRTVRLIIMLCALLLSASTTEVNAQTRTLPTTFRQWIASPGIKHATVALEVQRTLTKAGIKQGALLYTYDAERLMAPASVLKLVTAATALRTLGPDYVWPDSIALVDTALVVPLAGLEHYNPDWLIEDIETDYMPPLCDLQPDSGRVLTDIVTQTLAESLNLQAETMMRLLTPSCRLDSGLTYMQGYWQQQGLDPEQLSIYDGCGLAPADRVTPRYICQLLNLMATDKTFRQTLPRCGFDGTVRNFLRGSRLEGKARAKSGTLKTAVTYAGYATGSDGHTYTFCVMVNNYGVKPAVVRRGIQNLLLSLIP